MQIYLELESITGGVVLSSGLISTTGTTRGAGSTRGIGSSGSTVNSGYRSPFRRRRINKSPLNVNSPFKNK